MITKKLDASVWAHSCTNIKKVVEYCGNLGYVMFYYKEIISKLPRKELEKIGEAVGIGLAN